MIRDKAPAPVAATAAAMLAMSLLVVLSGRRRDLPYGHSGNPPSAGNSHHEHIVKLTAVHVNRAEPSLSLAFDYAEHDLYETIWDYRDRLAGLIRLLSQLFVTCH